VKVFHKTGSQISVRPPQSSALLTAVLDAASDFRRLLGGVAPEGWRFYFHGNLVARRLLSTILAFRD